MAYLARLTRPDGRTYLHIVGVHAVGSPGVIHYLASTATLHELHRAVGSQRFSMVVGCQFTTDPLRILASQPLTPPLSHPAS